MIVFLERRGRVLHLGTNSSPEARICSSYLAQLLVRSYAVLMADADAKKDSEKRARVISEGAREVRTVTAAGTLFGPPDAAVATLALLLPEHAIGWVKEKRARRITTFH